MISFLLLIFSSYVCMLFHIPVSLYLDTLLVDVIFANSEV